MNFVWELSFEFVSFLWLKNNQDKPEFILKQKKLKYINFTIWLQKSDVNIPRQKEYKEKLEPKVKYYMAF